MRRAWITEPGKVSVREEDLAAPGPGEVQVATARVGVCGSDLHALHGTHPFIPLPVSPGHEAVGRVVAVGSETSGLLVGDRVLLEPNVVCGRCRYCTDGRYNLCERLAVVGCQLDGALADRFNVRADRLHRVPGGLTNTQAAMVEPLSTATHALRVAQAPPPPVVAVLGAGTIGLATLLAARAGELAAVAVTDPSPAKRELAAKLGADVVADPTADDLVASLRTQLPRRPDLVFDCVSTQATTAQAVGLAQNGGTIVVVGVPTGPVTVEWPLVQDKELRIQGTAMYTGEDVQRAIDLVSAGAPVQRLVTAELPLDRVADAFALAEGGNEIKVHVLVDEQA